MKKYADREKWVIRVDLSIALAKAQVISEIRKDPDVLEYSRYKCREMCEEYNLDFLDVQSNSKTYLLKTVVNWRGMIWTDVARPDLLIEEVMLERLDT